MKDIIQASSRTEIIRIVAVYAVVGALWIYLSDSFLEMLIDDPHIIARISIYKGLMFIALTSTLLYVLISRYVKRISTHLDERNQALQMIAQQKTLLDLVVEGTTDAVYIKDADGRYLLANSAVSRFVNKPVQEIIGHDDTKFFPREEALALMEKEKWIMSRGETFTYEECLTTHDGERFFSSTKGPVFGEDGSVTGLFGISRDITQRTLVERTLDKRTSLLDALLANLPVGVFMVEAPSGKPLIANQKAQELLGRGILPAVNRENLSELYEVYKSGTSERYPNDEMPIVRGMRGESVCVDDLLVVRPDGTSRLLEIFGAPVLDQSGNPWASLVCFQDITDRKDQEDKKLRFEKLESLGVLAGGIAHDFNNILTGIMGNISFARIFIEQGHSAFNPLVEAEQASVRARELSQQLLTFAKGGKPIKREIVIRRLVAESVSLVLRGSNVKGNIYIDDSVHSVRADEGQIEQVFHNMVLNATQAMPGGGNLTISARNLLADSVSPLELAPGPYVAISFADEGCGITDDALKKIFDPYFTTKSAGNGLGLASAHSIITRHGGGIDVESKVGKGSTFTVYLPSTGKTLSGDEEPLDGKRDDSHTGGTILVMDDEEVIRDVSAEMLEYLGYKVTKCSDGDEAVNMYLDSMKSGSPFFAVIMDLTIPGGMGGKEAAVKILAIDSDATLVVSSGYSNDPIMADYANFGFSAAVAKPYTISELGRVLSILQLGAGKRPEL
ncbi:MAG: PAS domain-containing protein [Desulfuromonadaceae bacterium]|nr:PAS domain-containing protein [Desulfuromonadaceae bacterium]MDD2856129.1 PAS domain-containing protein [Desulfuromonadaceae bacterium]